MLAGVVAMVPDKSPTTIEGACHCGNLRFEFATLLTPSSLPVRSCQCSFCRGHGAATARDPGGSVRISAGNPDAVTLYRFGTNSTDFVLCGNCGMYLGAVISHGGKQYATLNMRLTALDISRAEPVVYDSESVEDRVARRIALFTPVIEWPF